MERWRPGIGRKYLWREYCIIVIKFFAYMQRNKVFVLLVTVTYVIESGMVVLLLKVVAFIFLPTVLRKYSNLIRWTNRQHAWNPNFQERMPNEPVIF